MPGFFVGLHHFCPHFAELDSLNKVILCQASTHLNLLLLRLVIKVPLAQFEVALTQLLWVLNLFVVDHFFEHLGCTLLLASILVIFKDRKFYFGQFVLDTVLFVLILSEDVLFFYEVDLELV